MTEQHDDIIEHVRRAAPIGDRAIAGLVDPAAKQELLYRVLSTPLTEDAAPAGRTRLPRLALAGAATGVILAGGVGVLVALDGSGPPAVDPPVSVPPATAGGDSVALGGEGMQCVEQYGPETLAARTFAFDGTVTGIGQPASPDELYVPVTFQVAEWFRGGDADEFVVSMFPPDVVTSVDNGTYEVGSRLLVSGEDLWGNEQLTDPVVWYCGFTRTYSPDMADQWRQAFTGR